MNENNDIIFVTVCLFFQSNLFSGNNMFYNVVVRFEQAFINSLLKEYIGSETLYFWTGLQDSKGSGEYQFISPDGKAGPVTYTNWRWLEPGTLNTEYRCYISEYIYLLYVKNVRLLS